jgi:hypothetical protein
MFTLATTSYFDWRVAKFIRTHPEQKKQLAKVFRGLEADPRFSESTIFNGEIP